VTRVSVYVEGKSDKLALERLLGAIVRERETLGVRIEFFAVPQRVGDAKVWLTTKLPVDAARRLRVCGDEHIAVVPDLYPQNKGIEHETAAQLRDGMRAAFEAELTRIAGGPDPRIAERFHTFCLKHDLEALLLAARSSLASVCGAKKIEQVWAASVEDQNQDDPPRRVVERVFADRGKQYRPVLDAPLVLGEDQLATVRTACPECFEPFVKFVETVA